MDKVKLGEIYSELRNRVEILGYDCVGFELIAEEEMNILRIYVDMPGGINLSDCETVARDITEYLDENEGALPERYFLEVSSPGLERPLFVPDDYRKFIGREAQVTLKRSRSVLGVITAVDEYGAVRILSSEGEKEVPFSDIKKGKLIYKEEKGQKKTFKKIPKKK